MSLQSFNGPMLMCEPTLISKGRRRYAPHLMRGLLAEAILTGAHWVDPLRDAYANSNARTRPLFAFWQVLHAIFCALVDASEPADGGSLALRVLRAQ